MNKLYVVYQTNDPYESRNAVSFHRTPLGAEQALDKLAIERYKRITPFKKQYNGLPCYNFESVIDSEFGPDIFVGEVDVEE